MTRSRTGTLPLRLGYHLQQSSSSGGAVQPAGHTQDAAVFRRDRFLSQVRVHLRSRGVNIATWWMLDIPV